MQALIRAQGRKAQETGWRQVHAAREKGMEGRIWGREDGCSPRVPTGEAKDPIFILDNGKPQISGQGRHD